jgi:hypothetical protein
MPTAEDVPEAPRAWRWAAGRGNEAGRIAPSSEWIQSSRPSVGERDNRRPAYAPQFLRAGSDGKAMIPEMAPRVGSPMQFVSPGAAAYAAALVGCRLPTPAEWQLAAGSGAPAEGTPNLRDQTWQAQHDYVAATRRQMIATQDQFIWPDARVFPAAGAAVGEAAAPVPGAAADGWVWFAPVVEGATGFAHLRGNVAEYVVGGATSGPLPADARSANEFVNRRSRDIAVIGASALSAAEEKPETPLPLGDLDSLGGWSDVGFRLAFSATGTQAPRRSMAEVVASLLSGSGADPYLLKK